MKVLKECNKCRKHKSLENFTKNKKGRDGRYSQCRDCVNEKNKIKYINNSDKIKKQTKEYKANNKEKVLARGRIYYKNNKHKIQEYNRINKEQIQKRKRKYYLKNKEWLDKKRNESYNKKYAEDSLFNLSIRLSKTIQKVFKQAGVSKNKSKIKILGCTCEEFKEYLENNPYGFKVLDKDIDLDHIIPKKTAKKESELYSINHYTNFQLLPKEYNRFIKIDSEWNRDHFKDWIKNKKHEK